MVMHLFMLIAWMVDKTWGTIIPNNLANGIQRIAQHALTDGSLINNSSSPNGVYGATSTANASGGLTELVINGSSLTLPVSLKSFTGSVAANKVNLVWRTASESNFSSFGIESSKNATDYTTIGSKAARGSNSEYTFEDILTPGITYYRLKMIDIDSKFKYSQVVAVNGSLSGSANNLSIYPNPVKSNLFVSHSKAKAGATAEVITFDGKLLFSQKIAQNNTQTSIGVNSLSAGNYILIYKNGSEKQILHFKKQ